MLPGAFWHYDVYENIISSIHTSIFYDGVNNCSWNGGRNNIKHNVWNDEIANNYYGEGHSIAMTFSNSIVNVDDIVGNELLSNLSRHDNYVILRNESLRKYIRNTFPRLSLIYSIIGTQSSYERDFYGDLLNKYDYIVPRYHHVLNIIKDFPSDIGRFEVMINHTCPSTCPMWNKHYSMIDEDNRLSKTYHTYDTKTINCLINEEMTDSNLLQKNLSKRLDKLLRLGVQRFKMAGREFSKERLKNELSQIKDYL